MAEKILIVDDDLETLRLIGMMLQKQGYQVVSAKDGTEAIALAFSEHPDMIVLDIMMPDPDGYQVAKHLRADSRDFRDSHFDVYCQVAVGTQSRRLRSRCG